MSSLWNDEERSSVTDHCWPQALSGILLALSSEGDIIYLSENVTQQLGLPQVVLYWCNTQHHNMFRGCLIRILFWVSLVLIYSFVGKLSGGSDWTQHLRLLPSVWSRRTAWNAQPKARCWSRSLIFPPTEIHLVGERTFKPFKSFLLQSMSKKLMGRLFLPLF